MQKGKDDQYQQRRADLTRREWLLRLGETVALVGFSGVAGQAEGVAASLLAGSAQPALPPGLYEPSNDHLSHALMADDRFQPIPPETETDYVRPRSGPFQPQFFSPSEFQVVVRIVKLMLGDVAEPSSAGNAEKTGLQIVEEVAEWLDLTVFSATEVREAARRMAPEHRILAVHHYGATAVEEVENNEAQKVCREGLKWLTDQSEGGDFLKLSEEQQTQLLGRISDGRADKAAQNKGTPFFRLIKAGVVHGFYTSRLGLKELDYKGNAFYAESPGCPGRPT